TPLRAGRKLRLVAVRIEAIVDPQPPERGAVCGLGAEPAAPSFFAVLRNLLRASAARLRKRRTIRRRRRSGCAAALCVGPRAQSVWEFLAMMQQNIRIRLKAFDHRTLDLSAKEIVSTAK